jgi:hypothetical protein
MKVEIEGRTQTQAERADGIEPGAHQLGITRGVDAATVFGQEGAFGNDVQTGEQSESFIENIAHHMAVAGIAKEFERQQGTHGLAGGDHVRARQTGAAQHLIEFAGEQIGQKQKQTAELGAELTGPEIQGANVGDIGAGGTRTRRPFLVETAWQAGKAFLFEDAIDGHGTKGKTFVEQGLANIVDGEILFT